MITFKQMDAFIWIVNTGSFESAAARLNLSQSAISKRIQELEDVFGLEIFDRSLRGARLTEKGQELYEYCITLAQQRDFLVERMCDKKVLNSSLRLGVTEITAMTWLPAFIAAVRDIYPQVNIEPVINTSAALYEALLENKLDYIVIPDVYSDTRVITAPLEKMDNVWMCAPSLVPEGGEINQSNLSSFTFLTQGKQSGVGLIYHRYFANKNLAFIRTLECNNLLSQLSLAIAGMGITYLPVNVVQNLVDSGKLILINIRPRPPIIRYAGMYLADRNAGFIPDIAQLAKKTCCFTETLMF